MQDTSPSVRSALADRTRQQEFVARFAQATLREAGLPALLQLACEIAAEGIGCRFAKILQHEPETNTLLVRAGVGWREGVVGHQRLGGDRDSPAGYALLTGQSVVTNDLPHETRFRTPRLLMEHGLSQAVNVPIPGRDGPFGVLEVDAAGRLPFTDTDATFLSSLATMLALAMAQQARLDALHQSEAFARSVLAASSDCVVVLATDGTIESISDAGCELLGIAAPDAITGRFWRELWPAEARPEADAALVAARGGEVGKLDAMRPSGSAERRWWDVSVRLIGTGAPARLVAVARDISERVAASETKDLLMLEVHHRVKNSLQMVQNLLLLQAQTAADTLASAQLREGAARVHTISAIHDRLYKSGGDLTVEVGPYLDGLAEDLRTGMASTQRDRRIEVAADSGTLSAADASNLGLVLTELVTNALKYGSGTIRIVFRRGQDGSCGQLIVSDEGCALPPDFDPARSSGLGMRLVTGLLRGTGAGLVVERDGARARFVARLPVPRPL